MTASFPFLQSHRPQQRTLHLEKADETQKCPYDYVQPASLSHLFFNLKTQWQKGTSENTLNIHLPGLGHKRRASPTPTSASGEAPRSGLVTARSPGLWGSPPGTLSRQYPPSLDPCAAAAPREAPRRAGAAGRCLSPATPTPADGLGEPQPMVPTTYQGCLLTMYGLERQYSTYGFATTSLWVLPTSLALAQRCEWCDVSQTEELISL